MPWLILVVAGLFEVGWAWCLKASRGFTRPWPTLGFVLAMIASLVLLGLSLRTLPLGTAYSVWTGVGAIGTVVVGILVLGEPASPARLLCLALILAGIVGLKRMTPPP